MKLTELEIKNARPGASRTKLADGKGLFLEIYPHGGKSWRYRFPQDGKEQTVTLGTYPGMGLAEARNTHKALRDRRISGVNLIEAKREEKRLKKDSAANTFEALARAWHTDNAPHRWTARHAHEILRRMENHIFPELGSYTMQTLTPQLVLRAMKGIEKTGSIETAHRSMQIIGQALRWGVQHGRADRDFTPDLRGALASAGNDHHARLPVTDIPQLLKDLEAAKLYAVTRLAIDWIFLTACRTGEMRGATWAEIDLDRNRWTIRPERMKAGTQHIVPLTKQSRAILDKLQALGLSTDADRPVFPAMQSQAKVMSENTILYAFNRMGYAGRQTPHGVRGLFSTYLNESGKWQFADIELCLAHQTGNEVSRAYNSAQRVPERARLLQWWADELDRMRDGGKPLSAGVIDLHRDAA